MQEALRRIAAIQNDELDLSNLGLTELPLLPDRLQVLYCGYNQLTELPPLPNTLQELYCNGNQLTEIPTLPDTLVRLYCYGNQLTELVRGPASPASDAGSRVPKELPDGGLLNFVSAVEA